MQSSTCFTGSVVSLSALDTWPNSAFDALVDSTRGHDGFGHVVVSYSSRVGCVTQLVPHSMTNNHPSVDHGLEVSVFDMDSVEELEFEENLVRELLHSARCASPEKILPIG